MIISVCMLSVMWYEQHEGHQRLQRSCQGVPLHFTFNNPTPQLLNNTLGPKALVILSPIWLCFDPSKPISRDLSCIYTHLVVIRLILGWGGGGPGGAGACAAAAAAGWSWSVVVVVVVVVVFFALLWLLVEARWVPIDKLVATPSPPPTNPTTPPTATTPPPTHHPTCAHSPCARPLPLRARAPRAHPLGVLSSDLLHLPSI